MPKTAAQARPADLKRTVRRLLSYMGHAKFSLLAVGVLASVAAIASLAGTYMVRPIVNGLATGGEELLAKQVILTAIIYAAGVLSALGYSQIMVRAAQRVVSDIRRDLFAHIQTLPLSYFDSTRSGDIMSFFTNDVDTVSEALNNSFANVIQATIQVVGTTAMLIILNWQLTIITLVCDAAIVLYARYSGARSKRFFAAQQASLGDLDGYIEEMVSGQKVIKVFNREAANVTGFTFRNDELRRTGTAAVSYANSMVPMTVVIGYVNYAIVAVAGGMLCIKGLADVGALASYLVFVRQAAMPINQFTQLGNFLLNALAGAERLFAAMDLEPEVDEGCVELVQTGDAAWAWKIPEGQGVGAYGHLHDVAAVDESGRAVAADGTELTCGLVPLAGDVRFHAVDFSYVPVTRVLTDLNLFAKPGQKIAFVGSTGAARRPSPTSSTASTRSLTARSRTTASTSSTLPRPACAGRSALCCRTRTCLAAPLRRTSALASSTRPTRRCAPLPRPPAPTRLSAACRGATTHRSRPTAPTCRRVSVSCSPSRAWPSPIRRCSSWTRPRAPLTRVPKSSSSAVWTASCADAPRL